MQTIERQYKRAPPLPRRNNVLVAINIDDCAVQGQCKEVGHLGVNAYFIFIFIFYFIYLLSARGIQDPVFG